MAAYLARWVVKIKFFDFKTTTHERASRQMPGLEDFRSLFKTAWERRAEKVRLIGLGVRLATEENATDNPQLSFSL